MTSFTRFSSSSSAGERLVLAPEAQRQLVGELVELGIDGGALYDAFVAITARSAGATLLSCDRRAATTYERCGARTRYVA